jgi:diguanylate cyclase (GGDEF)-like protein/putative nucleotidyltransferase with HDIG domain
MPSIAKLYISLVALLGLAAFVNGIYRWENSNTVQFVIYLLIAALASAFKVHLPAITGTMSVNSLFILVSIVQLPQRETMAIGLLGNLIQCVWKPRSRIRLVRVVFSLAATALAISASYAIYDNALLTGRDLEVIRVLSAACGYFIVNTLLVAIVVALTEQKDIRKTWLECYFWCFPYYLGGAGIAWLATVLNRRVAWQASLVLLPVVYVIYRSYKLYLQRLEDEKKHVEDMAGLHLRTIEALALAIEAKDHTTHDHLRRVRIYALEIGARMGLSELELQSLRAAALLHDIGKLAVPEHIISKPGKLTPEEFEKMKIHPVVGAQILEQVQFPYPVVPIVRSHHEKWDGTGYPSGLKGEEIPIGARILSAVDCLDALASDRQYRRALPLDQAMGIVEADSGKAFDPAVVALLKSCYAELEYKAVSQPRESVRLDTDMVIEKGVAPATGFEQSAGIPATNGSSVMDPLSSIAAARHEGQSLYELTQDLGNSLSLGETLSVVGERLKRLVPYDSIAVYVKRDRNLVPEYVNGENFRLFSSLSIPVGEGLSGWVAKNEKPMLNGNPSVEAGYLNDPTKFSTLRSALAVPLVGINGVIGVITLYRAEKDAFSADHLRILLAISFKVSMAIDNALRFRQVETSATIDYLTNLLNARSLFMSLDSELARCRRLNINLALVVCDLDGFKQINDRFGHPQGDRVLRYVATGLRQSCRLFETAARMGGDEFVLLLPDVTPEALEARIQEVRRIALEAGRLTPDPSYLSFSVGAAVFPADGTDAETLLSEADHRMYRSKQLQQTQRTTVDPEMAGLRQASVATSTIQ